MSDRVFVMGDFDSKFMQDDELRSLLRQWSAPDVPNSLDNRVAATYQRVMGEPAALNSAFHSQRDSEVVTMKFCSTCEEQFADRFSFCPVDGTPLSAVPAAPAAPVSAPLHETFYPVAEGITSKAAVEPEYFEAATATSATAPAAKTATLNAVNVGEYHLTILEDAGLLSRLADELGEVAHNYQLTWPEFKRDPFGFVKRSLQGYGQMIGRFFASRDAVIASGFSLAAMAALVGLIFLLDRTQGGGTGVSRKSLFVVGILAFCGLLSLFATSLSRDRGAAVMGARPSDSRNVLSGIIAAFAVLGFVVGGLFVWDRHQMAKAAEAATDDDLELTQMISDIPNSQPTPDEGTAGMAKGNGGGSKPKQEKAGGGGGGGREEAKPASTGKLPQASLTVPQILPPDPKPPVIKNPSLPVAATVNADPMLGPPEARVLPYGDPKSKSTDPSSGPGKGNGIGTGTGTGVGSGEGNSIGPGRGGNIGGGDFNAGGGGPGGGGGGEDYKRVFSGKDVSKK